MIQRIKPFIGLLILLMSVYSKGACYERELLELLKSKGFTAVRVAGSGRARMEQPDLLASNGSRTLGIECKYSGSNYKSISKEEVNALFKFCKGFNCTALLAFRFPRQDWKFMIIIEEVTENVNVKARDELLNLMNVYGWSNIIEGILFIVIASKSRNLTPLALILAGLFTPMVALTNNLSNISLAGADWSGAILMLGVYMPLCLLPVIVFYIQKFRRIS